MASRPARPVGTPLGPAAQGGPAAEGAPGSARELTRGRRTVRTRPETGRQHHLGTAPAEMPVLTPHGPAATTRVAAVQLAARTEHELAALAERIAAEMTRAATDLQFEVAAALRDEWQAVRDEIARRPDRLPPATAAFPEAAATFESASSARGSSGTGSALTDRSETAPSGSGRPGTGSSRRRPKGA